MSPELHPIRALIDRGDVLQRIKHEFAVADPYYDQRRAALWDRLTPLADQVDKLQEQGHSVDCSQQHRLEAQWLLNYTADWPRAETTLKDLETSLANHDQPPLEQDPGGSWGPCCTELYRKIEPTVGELQDPNLGHGVALQPLAFMAIFQDMDWLVADLQRLQVSDIRQTRRNNRDELGSLQASLAQLFFKSSISSVLTAHPELKFSITPPMTDKLLAYFVANQDADTGFWGPTYLFDGQPLRVQDLSFTFHFAHFRKGNIPNLARIVDTILKIKDLRYPAGWKPDDKRQYSDHNNYDLVTLLGYGWQQAPALQPRIAAEIQAMVDWCMTQSRRQPARCLLRRRVLPAADRLLLSQPEPVLDDSRPDPRAGGNAHSLRALSQAQGWISVDEPDGVGRRDRLLGPRRRHRAHHAVGVNGPRRPSPPASSRGEGGG
jgi:hypothetical protein